MPEVVLVAVVLRDHAGRVLFVKQSEDRAYGGLWSPPMVAAVTLTEARQRLASMGIDASELIVCGHTTHLLSHRRLRVTVVRADPSHSSTPKPNAAFRWLDPRAPVLVGTSTLCRKVLALVENG